MMDNSVMVSGELHESALVRRKTRIDMEVGRLEKELAVLRERIDPVLDVGRQGKAPNEDVPRGQPTGSDLGGYIETLADRIASIADTVCSLSQQVDL